MSTLAFQGFGHEREIGPLTRLECKICWTVYDPAEGDPVWQIPPGTPFDRLPPHWTCPNCSATREQFMVLGDADGEPTLPDPAPRLAAAFRAAATRMPPGLVNAVLDVEAVGFAPWQGHWLGVMVTPWFMNLMLQPRAQSRWQSLRVGDKRTVQFPAGIYEFIGASEPSVGEYQSCSLFSPMDQFENHEAARLVAQLARQALLDPANAEPPEDVRNARPVAGDESEAISKRDFLRARFAGGGDGD